MMPQTTTVAIHELTSLYQASPWARWDDLPADLSAQLACVRSLTPTKFRFERPSASEHRACSHLGWHGLLPWRKI